MKALIARVLDRVAPVRPAETSFLDIVNGVVAERCAYLDCPHPPTAELHGFKLCTGHRKEHCNV